MQEAKALKIKDAVVTIDSQTERFPKKDRFVQQIKEKFEQRSQTGIKKYGTTLERDDLSLQDWLTHFEEELMDGLLYLQVLKDKLK